MQGTIKRLSDRGFGFIAPADDGSRDHEHFFHARDLRNVHFRELRVGDVVVFDSAMNEKGLAARNVEVQR